MATPGAAPAPSWSAQPRADAPTVVVVGPDDGSTVPVRTGISPLTGTGYLPRSEPAWHDERRGEAPGLPYPMPGPDDEAVSPRFQFISTLDGDSETSWPRRILQVLGLVAIVAGAASLMVVLPDDDSVDAGDAQATTRIETSSEPIATSEMLLATAGPAVDGSLASAGDLVGLSLGAGSSSRPSDAPGSVEAFSVALTDVTEEAAAPPPTTTTTVWVEPTIPPESAWVDAGNGVAVPDVLLRIRFCESTNNYQAANPRSTASGAYQFLDKSWDWYGHAARTGVAEAHLATRAQQDEAALRTLQSEGTRPWLASRNCWSADDIDPRYATAAPPVPTTTTTAADQTTSSTDPSSTTETTSDSSSTTETTTPSSTSSTDPSTTTTDPSTTTTESTTTTTATSTSS